MVCAVWMRFSYSRYGWIPSVEPWVSGLVGGCLFGGSSSEADTMLVVASSTPPNTNAQHFNPRTATSPLPECLPDSRRQAHTETTQFHDGIAILCIQAGNQVTGSNNTAAAATTDAANPSPTRQP